ncbi:MAG: glycosyltransferase family 4 protein [Pseudomonadota bacterium]
MTSKLRALILAPHLDAFDVGESLTRFRLVEELSRLADLTVLALECTKGPPLSTQLPDAEVVTFEEPEWLRRHERMRAMFRPNIFYVARYAEKWLRKSLSEGRTWDVAHQILPAAPRYPTIFRKFDIPYIVGSLGGALPTPDAFSRECGSASWYTRLRALDQVRFRFDPWLRSSYASAELVLGVAPYMNDVLKSVPKKRFEPFLAIGVDSIEPLVERQAVPGSLKLLHVGRAVRTKGLRDVVRAMAYLSEYPGVSLTSIGGGEEIAICKAEAERLGVAERIEFLGKLPRDEIENHYRDSDVFVFPSFRESMGGVLFEAMRWGLPIITVDSGGPGFIVTEETGLKVPLTDPERLPVDIADAVKRTIDDPSLRINLGLAGRQKLLNEQLWNIKAEQMLKVYASVASAD